MRIVGTLVRATFRAAAVAACLCVLAAPGARAHESHAEEVALGSLVDAENAFAAMAHERGVRAAFLASFAPDGIVFEPAPVRLHEAWRTRPEPADPRAVQLAWQPAQAGVAHAFDIGFTTGPYTLRDAEHPGAVRHGVFFSVWQREGTGPWQVIVDAGISTPGVVDFVPLGEAPRAQFTGSANPAVQRRRVLDLERRALLTGPGAGVRYGTLLAPAARLHRDGMPPVAGRDAVDAEMARLAGRVAWTPLDARVARSGDLAVTWGRYRETAREGRDRDGYYTHLWLRDGRGSWRLAYDIATPSSPRE